jgi:hypothetical protein
MPIQKQVQDIEEGDRVLMAGCMEFTVASNERVVINDKVYARELVHHELTLDDGLSAKESDELGALSLHKDPTDELPVLVEGEGPPQAVWQS